MEVPPRGDQVPPLNGDMNDDQDPVDPPLTDGSVRSALFKMSQSITNQAQASTSQSQSMKTKGNREVVP